MAANHETEFITLENDLLFHMVFSRNKKALIGLLGSVLNLPEGAISRVDILNPIQYSESILTKQTILDLKVHLNDDRYVLVEMQVRKFDYWTNRTVAYASRQVADQITRKFDYEELEPVIQVSIMNYSLFPDHKRFFARYIPRDEEGYPYTEELQFCVWDLTQVDHATDEQVRQGLVEWARLFRADSWDEVDAIDNPCVKEATKTMELILSNPIERELVRARMDAENDMLTQLNAARRRGETIGEERGKDLGKADAAKSMKEDGLPPEKISQYTGLSLEDIASL